MKIYKLNDKQVLAANLCRICLKNGIDIINNRNRKLTFSEAVESIERSKRLQDDSQKKMYKII